MIKIGISACFMYPDSTRLAFSPKSLTYMENSMVNFLTRKGIMPVLIPDVAEEFLIDILSELDAIVMHGGVDLAPQTYGETPIGIWEGDAYRDAYELKILDFAVKHSKPVFGICRGFQLMNAYFGGTLYQDIPTQLPNIKPHYEATLYEELIHPIKFVEGSFLDELYANETNPQVNSIHHQAAKDLGKDLEIYAYSDDGLIEAFGYTKEPPGKIMAVQWHPEFSLDDNSKIINPDLLLNNFLTFTKT